MPVSAESVICPYCKAKQSKSLALGDTGLINYRGSERTLSCRKCAKDFKCEISVTIKFKTTKDN